MSNYTNPSYYIDLADDVEETTPIDLGAWLPVDGYTLDDVTESVLRALEAV